HRAGRVHSDTDALSCWHEPEDEIKKTDKVNEEKTKEKGIRTIEEKDWLLSLAEYVTDDGWEEGRNCREVEPRGYNEEEDELNTHEEYQELLEELTRKSESILTWNDYDTIEESWWSDDEYEKNHLNLDETYGIELPKWGEPVYGTEFSDEESDWDDDKPYEAKTWLGTGEAWWNLEEKEKGPEQEWEDWYRPQEECEVFIMGHDNSDKENIKPEPEDNPTEPVTRVSNSSGGRVPDLGLLTSPFLNPGENSGRRFVIEEYRRELEHRELILDVLLESGVGFSLREDSTIQSESELEDDKENTNLEPDDEKGDEFWRGAWDDDEETIITQEGEDRCHERKEESEAFIVKIEDDREQKRSIKMEDNSPEPTEQIPNEMGNQVSTRNMTTISFWKMDVDYRSALNFTHLNRSYGRIFHVYFHPMKLEHFALEVINRGKTIYLTEQFGYRLIAHDPRNLLTLKEWIVSGAQQELARREYLMATGIDLGSMESINVEAINTYWNEQLRDRLQQAQAKMKERHDKQLKPGPKLEIGDKVLVYHASVEYNRSVKLEPKWKGPYYVHE
ncbi:9108_t:CDS:2, partial [Dentiscutata heterogama]